MDGQIRLAWQASLTSVLWSGAAMLAAGAALAGGAPTVGSVAAVSGEVRVTSHGAEPRQLEPGDDLYEGDHIETARGARARLQLEDDSVVQLGGSSILDLEWVLHAPALDSRNVILSLPEGIVRLIIETFVPRSSFEVKTSTAVAAIQGTGGILEAKPRTTAVVAVGGEITVANVRPDIVGSVVLEPGTGTVVRMGEPPVPARAWPEERSDVMHRRTGIPDSG